MSGLCLLPTVQSFVPSISLLPGEPHIALCTTACYKRPHPFLYCTSEHLQFKGCAYGKSLSSEPHWKSAHYLWRIRLFIFPLTLSGNVNVLGVGSGPNIQDFVSGDNINQAWYGHAENSYVIFDWFWHPNVDWLSCCVQSWGNLVDIPRQWQKYSRGMAIQ